MKKLFTGCLNSILILLLVPTVLTAVILHVLISPTIYIDAFRTSDLYSILEKEFEKEIFEDLPEDDPVSIFLTGELEIDSIFKDTIETNLKDILAWFNGNEDIDNLYIYFPADTIKSSLSDDTVKEFIVDELGKQPQDNLPTCSSEQEQEFDSLKDANTFSELEAIAERLPLCNPTSTGYIDNTVQILIDDFGTGGDFDFAEQAFDEAEFNFKDDNYILFSELLEEGDSDDPSIEDMAIAREGFQLIRSIVWITILLISVLIIFVGLVAGKDIKEKIKISISPFIGLGTIITFIGGILVLSSGAIAEVISSDVFATEEVEYLNLDQLDQLIQSISLNLFMPILIVGFAITATSIAIRIIAHFLPTNKDINIKQNEKKTVENMNSIQPNKNDSKNTPSEELIDRKL